MAASIDFPAALENAADKIAMVRTRPSPYTADQAAALAGKLRVTGKTEDKGALFEVRSRSAILHCFHASDSMRWEHADAHACDTEPVALDIRKPDELTRIATAFLDKMGLADPAARASGVTFGTVSRSTARSRAEPRSTPTCAYVHFAFTVAELPVFGPGAKMRVTIGAGGKVLGCYKFWRAPAVDAEVRPTISYALAKRHLALAPAFANLSEQTRVTIDRMRLGYLALGPRHSQGALIPVYEIHGSVPTAWKEPHEFTRYLVCIDFTRDDLKRHQVADVHLKVGACNLI